MPPKISMNVRDEWTLHLGSDQRRQVIHEHNVDSATHRNKRERSLCSSEYNVMTMTFCVTDVYLVKILHLSSL